MKSAPYKIKVLKSVDRDVRKIDKQRLKHILNAVRALSENPHPKQSCCHLPHSPRKRRLSKITINPWNNSSGKTEEIAEAILYLASDKAGWITGETLSADSGRQLICAR